MASKPSTAKKPSHKALVRAVASSTAIETGKSVRQLEKVLRDKPAHLRTLTLAK